MNRLIALGVVLVAVIYLAFSSLYVVNVREQAIVMRFGQITDVKSEPGLYFKLPTSLVDTVLIVEDRLLRYNAANMRLQVKGGATYVVDAFLTYRITDPRKFREKAQGELSLAEQRIATRFEAALRQVYGLREFDAALSAQRPQMMKEARDLIKPDMADLGIDVTDVRILRTDLTQEVSAQTFERMKAERLAQAALLRAGGQEAAQSLRAIADRQAVEIVAAANKDSEILRGEGDAQRNAVYASAYGADPEFFEFYRSLQSYRTALGATGTTMVLSPKSEFFRYFEADTTDGTIPTPKAPGGIAPLPSTVMSVPSPTDVVPPADLGQGATPDTLSLDQATPAITPDPATPAALAPTDASSSAPAVNADGSVNAPAVTTSSPASSASSAP